MVQESHMKDYVLNYAPIKNSTEQSLKEVIFGDDFVPVQDGDYLLQLNRIEESTQMYGPVWEFYFTVIEGTSEGIVIRDFLNKKSLCVNSKLGRYYKALTGVQPRKAGKCNLSSLIGRGCCGHIILKEIYEDGMTLPHLLCQHELEFSCGLTCMKVEKSRVLGYRFK